MKVVTFGELLLRLATPGYTKLFQKDSFEATFCGAEANVAVSLSNYGLDSSFVTKLPNNDIGHAASNSLRYFGVDTTKIVYGDGRMGVYYLEKGVSQRPSKVVYDRMYSSFSMAKSEDFNWDILLDGADWFHWTGINPALSDNLIEICLDACKSAKDNGIVISCDLNFRSSLWSSDKAKKVMNELISYVDVCIANEEDADKVLGLKPKNNNVESGVLNRKEYEDVARIISKTYGCKYVAFSLRESYSASLNGWSGMLFDAKEDKAYYSNKYDIQIVDRVGGGDSFAAGIIYGLVSEKTNPEVIDFAVVASCLKQTIEGDFNRVTVDDIKRIIFCGGNGRVER